MIKTPRPGLVTVVVASYNHARFLERRMDSLLAQTYRDLEILVIDDCSPDNSVEILRRYESDPRVRLIVREQNGGWVAVSNQGIELANGEFVLFGNCDDSCDPRMIERLVESMRAHPTAGVAWCRSRMVDAHDREVGDDRAIQARAFQKRCADDTLIPAAEMSRILLHGCVISNLSAALFRATTFGRVGVLTSNYRACSDWELFFRVASVFDAAYLAEPLNHFRQHATTIRSRMKERETYEEYFRLLFAEAARLDLSFSERSRFRAHMMFLWATHLVSPSMGGIRNAPYHLRLLLKFDPVALLFLPWALARRVFDLGAKALGLRRRAEGMAG